MGFADELQKRLDAPPAFEGVGAAGSRKAAPRRDAYTVNQAVFVLYRPVESCVRCKLSYVRGVEAGSVDPNDEYSCPHVKKNEYLRVLQNCRDAGWALYHWKEETLKNGTVQTSVTWGEPRDEPAKSKARAAPVL